MVAASTDLVSRVLPVLVFLVALTVLAELADEVGVFDWAAHRLAVVSRGSTGLLVAAVVLLAIVVTVLLSLDTTAVLLTPAVVVVGEQAGLPTPPLAVLALWLANTASLLLPVSNLTNLLAWEGGRGGADAWQFLQHTWAPEVAAVAATVGVFLALHGRRLPRRFAVPAPVAVEDRVGFAAALVACLALGPLVVVGVPAWLAAGALALPLLAVVGARRRHVFRRPLVPWRPLLLATVLFTVLAWTRDTAAAQHLAAAAAHGSDWGGLLATAGVGAALANLANNLPAFLALEPGTTASTASLVALLIGVNCGPLVTVWGSMATILWRDRARPRGAALPLSTLAWQGALVGAASILAAVTALWWRS